jgi:hypothetical protein
VTQEIEEGDERGCGQDPVPPQTGAWGSVRELRLNPLITLAAKAGREDVTPSFRRKTECELCTCQDQKLTYTVIT